MGQFAMGGIATTFGFSAVWIAAAVFVLLGLPAIKRRR
jgi:hypothetical protein